MCIAILNTSNPLKKEYLENSWDNNDQGAGLLYNLNGHLHSYKCYDKKKFIKEYYKVRKQVKGKIVLHFRIATSGHKKFVNLHPFFVNTKLGFVHNGIISGLGDKDYSDTYQFNELLKKFKHDFLSCSSSVELIRNYIDNSKLLFLDSNDNHYIINEKLGHWFEGDWYSNDSYKSYNDFWYFGNERVTKSWSTTYTPTTFDYDTDWISDKELAERLSYYTNAMSYNIDYLADLLEMDKNSKKFADEIDEISYIVCSMDIQEIINYVVKEFYSDHDNKSIYLA